MTVRFMVDSTEDKDGHCETIMDYVVSWTLRRAQNECKNDLGKELLYTYSRRFLGMILGQIIKDDDIVEVETWKQESKIDIWARATVNGVMHDILIEDKYYSKLHDNQLERYKTEFDNWLDENLKESKRHYILLTCKEQWDATEYEGFGFEVYGWDTMIDAMRGNDDDLKPTGSDIFDEFWINW